MIPLAGEANRAARPLPLDFDEDPSRFAANQLATSRFVRMEIFTHSSPNGWQRKGATPCWIWEAATGALARLLNARQV